MKKALIVTAVLIIAGALIVLTTRSSDDSSQQGGSNAPASSSTPAQDSDEPAPESVTIVYTSSGFSPANYVVVAGGTVTVRNDGTQSLDFASGDHPAHTENSELNIGEVAPGESKTFTAVTLGTWDFHNHHRDAHGGILVVR